MSRQLHELLNHPSPEQEDRETLFLQVADEASRKAISWLDPLTHDVRTLFPNLRGAGVKRDIRRRFKVLFGLEDRLGDILLERERIKFVTSAVVSESANRWLLGWATLLVDRVVLLVTSHRLLLFSARGFDNAGRMTWQIPYSDIRRLRVGGLLKPGVIELCNGRKAVLSFIPMADRHAVEHLVAEQMDRAEGKTFAVPSLDGRDALCPSCAVAVVRGAVRCADCGVGFLPARRAAWYALLLPGLGHLYMGHRLMAGFELAATLIMWMILSELLVRFGVQMLPTATLALLLYNGMAAWMTHHFARDTCVQTSDAWRWN